MSTEPSELGEAGRAEAEQARTFERAEVRGPRLVSRDAEPLPSLLRRLADEVTTLFVKELALLKSETTASVNGVKTGIASLASGGAVTFAGVLFLLLAAVYGLSEVMQPWLAALIVGGVVTLIGLVMLLSGRKRLEAQAFRPHYTEASIRKDRDMIAGATHHEQH
ncbi:MAG TPA: phage holin family protein [Burkholderiales bacterium]